MNENEKPHCLESSLISYSIFYKLAMGKGELRAFNALSINLSI